MWFVGKNCPRNIAIFSNGDASTWEDKLGNYELVRYDKEENAIYKHSAENGNFLFKPDNDKNMWMVSDSFWNRFKLYSIIHIINILK